MSILTPTGIVEEIVGEQTPVEELPVVTKRMKKKLFNPYTSRARLHLFINGIYSGTGIIPLKQIISFAESVS